MNNTPVLLHDHNEFLNARVFLKGIEIYANLITSLANVLWSCKSFALNLPSVSWADFKQRYHRQSNIRVAKQLWASVHQLHHAFGASRHQRSWEAKEDVVRMCEKWYDYIQPGWCQPVRQEFTENECEALPGVAYPGARDNRSTVNTKTRYDDDVNAKRLHSNTCCNFW